METNISLALIVIQLSPALGMILSLCLGKQTLSESPDLFYLFVCLSAALKQGKAKVAQAAFLPFLSASIQKLYVNKSASERTREKKRTKLISISETMRNLNPAKRDKSQARLISV